MSRNNQIVIVEKNYNGKIEIEVEELKKLLDEAYDNGYSYGVEVGKNSLHNYWWTVNTDKIYTTGTPDYIYHPVVTCNSANAQSVSSSAKDVK